MPFRQQLAFLRRCEADAAERGHVAEDSKEQDLHFEYAAMFAAEIATIEEESRQMRMDVSHTPMMTQGS